MNISNNEQPTHESELNKNICLSNSYLSQHGLKKEHPGFPAINVNDINYVYVHIYRFGKYFWTG